MLSSQQRFLLRAARRKVTERDAFRLANREHRNGVFAGFFSTHPSFPGNNRRNDETTVNNHWKALPSVQPLRCKNALLRSSVLERAYPLGLGPSPVFWFSTTTKEEDSKEGGMGGYRERARSGAKSFSGMMKKYGPTFVYTYLSVYVANLSLFYLGIASGALDPVVMIGYVTGNHEEVRSTAVVVSELLEKYTITAPFAEAVKEKPNLANFAVAWISTKFTEPIRMGVSVAIVPTVARYFGTIPKTEEEIHKEQSEGVDAASYAEQREPEAKPEEKKP